MPNTLLASTAPTRRAESSVESPGDPSNSRLGPDSPRPAERPLRERVIGRLQGGGQAQAPTLIVIGSLHGNEPAGVLGVDRVVRALQQDSSGLIGELAAVVGNRQALRSRRRFLRYDLNRHWIKSRVEHLRSTDVATVAEDKELQELDAELADILAGASGQVFAHDLHTTSGHGPCFAILDDSLANRRFALNLPATLVVGIEEELAGTLSHHLDQQGVTVCGFEAGQHDDIESIDRAEAAVWIALEASGVIAVGSRPEVAQARDLLTEATGDLPHVVEVVYRHAITAADEFRMEPGWTNFRQVAGGEVIAEDVHGPIVSPEAGMMLMPLYQMLGEDGFFVVRRLRPVWLQISNWVRRMRLERFVHWLPGVVRHPRVSDTFITDRRWARWFALELFHLLGYRRRGPAGRFLVMTRRPHDR